jgi:hypothetical protein
VVSIHAANLALPCRPPQALPFRSNLSYMSGGMVKGMVRMILGLGRMLILMLALLSVVYVSLFLYLRAGVRMRLEEDWVMAGRPGDRDAWIDDRLSPVARRIRTWLIFLVYVLPLAGLSLYIYVTN